MFGAQTENKQQKAFFFSDEFEAWEIYKENRIFLVYFCCYGICFFC